MKLILELDHAETQMIADQLKYLWAECKQERLHLFEKTLVFKINTEGELFEPHVLRGPLGNPTHRLHLATIERDNLQKCHLRLHPLLNESYFSNNWLQQFKQEVESYGC